MSDDLLKWAGWDLIGAVAGVLALIIPVVFVWGGAYKLSTREQLNDPKDRARIKLELSGQLSAFDRYRAAIESFTGKLDSVFGNPWSFKAFDRCLSVALVYPIALLLIAWVFGLPGTIGTLELLPDLPPFERVFAALGLTTLSVGTFAYFKLEIPERLAKWLTAFLFPASTNKQRNVYWLQEFVELMAFAFAVAFAVAAAVAVAVAVAAAVAFAGTGTGTGGIIVQILIFLVLLPVVNALFDYISWGATRGLLSRFDHVAGNLKGALVILTSVAIDLLIAMVCLVCLVALIVLTLETANYCFELLGWPLMDWRSQMAIARQAPFTQGILVTGMLVSTLVPTILHLTIGLSHVFTVWAGDNKKVAALIDDNMPTSHHQKVAMAMLYRRIWLLPALCCSLAIVWVFGWAFSTWVEPFGLFLQQVAEFAASLI